jgi:hypothetical protein
MTVLPYCMVEAEVEISAPQHGVQSAPVQAISISGLRAFFSRLDSLAPDAATLRQSALEFHGVVSVVFKQTTVLPFRFPTLLVNIEELESHLQANAEEYRQTLRRLRGMVQMEVAITSGAEEARRASGTQYLKDRQGRQATLRQAADGVRSQAQQLPSDWRDRETKNGWRCYALIAGAAAAEFEEVVRCAKVPAGVQLAVSGPWPATEFVGKREK